MRRWNHGDSIVVRQLWRDSVWAVFPVIVVRDDATCTSVYMAPGIEFERPDCTRDEYLRVLASGSWKTIKDKWFGHHLWTYLPGEKFSIWTMWSEIHLQHLGWKINLEAPVVRTRLGLDATDHVLDVMVSPDLSFTLKDEDELYEAVELGALTRSECREIYSDAIEAINLVETKYRDFLYQLSGFPELGC